MAPVPAAAPVAPSAAAAPSEEEQILAIVNRLFPQRDWLEEARKRLGPAPAAPGKFTLSPWEMVALALPAVFGAPQASSAALRGALAAHAQRTEQARAQTENYLKRVADLAEQLEMGEARRGQIVAPYLIERAGERRRAALAERRLDLQERAQKFSQDLRTAQFAFEQFQWANPSASQQQMIRLREIDQQIRQNSNRAQEALAAGRLEEAERHNRTNEALAAEARALTRQSVDIARQRLALDLQKFQRQGSKGLTAEEGTRIVNYYKFVQEQARELKAQLAFTFDPAAKKEIQDQLGFYAAEESRLRPTVRHLTTIETPAARSPTAAGAPAPPAPGAPLPATQVNATDWARLQMTAMADRAGARTKQDYLRMFNEVRNRSKNPNDPAYAELSKVPLEFWQELYKQIMSLPS